MKEYLRLRLKAAVHIRKAGKLRQQRLDLETDKAIRTILGDGYPLPTRGI